MAVPFFLERFLFTEELQGVQSPHPAPVRGGGAGDRIRVAATAAAAAAFDDAPAGQGG